MPLPITEGEVVELWKTAADSKGGVAEASLGHGGYSWSNGTYAVSLYAMCKFIADTINQEVDLEREQREAVENTQKAKINEIITSLNQLIDDYDNAVVPTTAQPVGLL